MSSSNRSGPHSRRQRSATFRRPLVVRASLAGADSFFAAIELPPGSAYVLSGVSKGAATRNVAPAEATSAIIADGRTPITIEEGMAIWRVHPAAVAVNDGSSLAGSTRGDKRVPAIWISKSRPKLGWCFAGYPTRGLERHPAPNASAQSTNLRHSGDVAEWLRSGLQSRLHRFDSGRRLYPSLGPLVLSKQCVI